MGCSRFREKVVQGGPCKNIGPCRTKVCWWRNQTKILISMIGCAWQTQRDRPDRSYHWCSIRGKTVWRPLSAGKLKEQGGQHRERIAKRKRTPRNWVCRKRKEWLPKKLLSLKTVLTNVKECCKEVAFVGEPIKRAAIAEDNVVKSFKRNAREKCQIKNMESIYK